MTFFIQTCPCCARRNQLLLQSLGMDVECRFCNSTFRSFDGSEDTGEASDRMTDWAREQPLVQQEVEMESNYCGLPPR